MRQIRVFSDGYDAADDHMSLNVCKKYKHMLPGNDGSEFVHEQLHKESQRLLNTWCGHGS